MPAGYGHRSGGHASGKVTDEADVFLLLGGRGRLLGDPEQLGLLA